MFEAKTGKVVHVISDLPANITSLAFSADGRCLAAGLGEDGLRIFDREEKWTEIFRDTDYGGAIRAWHSPPTADLPRRVATG